MLDAFANSEHTTDTTRIMRAIEAGELKVRFISEERMMRMSDGKNYGGKFGPAKGIPGAPNMVYLNREIPLTDALEALAHEGGHYLFEHVDNALFPSFVRNAVNAEKTLYHEAYAFGVSSRYSKLNPSFSRSGNMHRASVISPIQFTQQSTLQIHIS